ncbi:MAG: iron-containing alcohol dehydrogenase [Oscillospiraceae bacterium]|nr:iron-containing alcohol dehydrogenase [Oscillospiraceae bacterium]
MLNFDYNTPTRVYFGKGTEGLTGALVKEQGCKKVLVHFGEGSVKRSGLLDKVYASLDEAGVSYVSLGGVVPNPRLSKVNEGIELCKKEGVDFILAVGGGSAIDSAKAISYGVACGGDVWDFFEGKREVTSALPVGTILTIAAAGSEMSNSAVVTNEDGWFKRGCSTELGRPKFSILNPELTYTLPPYQTASGVVDILMHTMERYFILDDTLELTDEIAEGLMRVVMKNCLIALKDAEDYNARAEIMWAGSLSHNGLTSCGNGNGDWSSHQMEHELGGLYDVAHGAGLSAIWGTWARYVYKEKPARFAQFAKNVMGVKCTGDDSATAIAGIEAMEDYFRSIKMPVSIGDMDIQATDAEIAEMAEKCSRGGTRTIGGFKALGRDDMAAIYTGAK